MPNPVFMVPVLRYCYSTVLSGIIWQERTRSQSRNYGQRWSRKGAGAENKQFRLRNTALITQISFIGTVATVIFKSFTNNKNKIQRFTAGLWSHKIWAVPCIPVRYSHCKHYLTCMFIVHYVNF